MITWKTGKAPAKAKRLNFYIKDENKISDAINIAVADNDLNIRKLRRVFRKAVSSAKAHKAYTLSVDISALSQLLSSYDIATLSFELLLQFELANYAFDKYKSKKTPKISTVFVNGADKKELKRAQDYAKYILHARDLANTPAEDMTPATLAEEAKKLARKDKKLIAKIYNKKALEKMGAGALLSVGKGSPHEPKLITLEYKGAKKKSYDLAIVGKGITFDSGGLDIKPAGRFADMNQDMSGGGAALCAVALAAALRLPVNVVAVVPAAENAVSGFALRPGDIIKTMSGKTIEIGHTDAEGRLVLADGISYAAKYKAKMLVTVATLTGAALVALGQEANAVMSKDEDLSWALRQWGQETGDYCWPLPLWDEYSEIMKGTFADLKNIQNKGGAGDGGTSTAGAFLYEFAKDLNSSFVHIDMAPRMTPGPNDDLPKDGGALGGPVALLVELMRRKV